MVIYVHIWPYPCIYGPIWAYIWPYMAIHVAIRGHIWQCKCSYLAISNHIWLHKWPYVPICGRFLKEMASILIKVGSIWGSILGSILGSNFGPKVTAHCLKEILAKFASTETTQKTILNQSIFAIFGNLFSIILGPFINRTFLPWSDWLSSKSFHVDFSPKFI